MPYFMPSSLQKKILGKPTLLAFAYREGHNQIVGNCQQGKHAMKIKYALTWAPFGAYEITQIYTNKKKFLAMQAILVANRVCYNVQFPSR